MPLSPSLASPAGSTVNMHNTSISFYLKFNSARVPDLTWLKQNTVNALLFWIPTLCLWGPMNTPLISSCYKARHINQDVLVTVSNIHDVQHLIELVHLVFEFTWWMLSDVGRIRPNKKNKYVSSSTHALHFDNQFCA